MEDFPTGRESKHIEAERLESRLARIDERTEWIQRKLQEHCDWKATASLDLVALKSANLPERLSKLENWRWYIGGGLTLITFLLIGRYIVLPGTLP